MAWSWSHTREAYCNALEQLKALPDAELLIIYAEWRAHQPVNLVVVDASENFNHKEYKKGLKQGWRMLRTEQGREALVDWVWERVENLATCTNGGWEAWVCPYGCHTVPFEPVEEEEAVCST